MEETITVNKIELLAIINTLKPVREIENQIVSWKEILADNNWASSGSEYHKKCRQDLKGEINELKKVLGFISKISANDPM